MDFVFYKHKNRVIGQFCLEEKVIVFVKRIAGPGYHGKGSSFKTENEMVGWQHQLNGHEFE